MSETLNYALYKPSYDERPDVEQAISQNMEKIDDALGEHDRELDGKAEAFETVTNEDILSLFKE